MEQIKDIYSEISKGRYIYHDLTILTSESDFYNIQDFSDKLSFINCHFKSQVNFNHLNDEKFRLVFHKCSFDDDIVISACVLDTIQFSFIKKIKEINITDSMFKKATFNSDREYLKGNLSIENTVIKENISFNKLNMPDGDLTLNIKKFNDTDFGFNSNFDNSAFNTLNFSFCDFGEIFNFRNSVIKTTSLFLGCNFKKTSFNKTDFGKESRFRDCKFFSYSGFEDCKNSENTNLNISACLFKSYPHFNGSEFGHLEITHSTFEKKVSFDSITINSLKINQVTFLQGAYFDDIKINKIENCDRKTIRTIKQELQKAENRIDFNSFRAYELAAHYEELDWKWNSGFIDKSILFLTKISTDFGNSWRKALRFTIIGGFIIYLLLYTIENRNVSINIFNWNNWARLFSGYFRFLLVTDFYNPLETDRIYLTNPFSWLILILGKIVVAFGIYEMIQSFRKFKA